MFHHGLIRSPKRLHATRRVFLLRWLFQTPTVVCLLSQSLTCWSRMDGSGRHQQRGHGGAGAGGQRDSANQPGGHGHRRLPHPLMAAALCRRPKAARMMLCLGRSASDVLSLSHHKLLLVKLVRHFLNFTSPKLHPLPKSESVTITTHTLIFTLLPLNAPCIPGPILLFGVLLAKCKLCHVSRYF